MTTRSSRARGRQQGSVPRRSQRRIDVTGGMTVLVVDDSPTARRHVRSCLEKMSMVGEVREAEDGEQGLRSVIDGGIDAVVLDLEMPRMDGYSFLRILTANHAIPVIVFSSHAGATSVFQALELGAIDFVAKPRTYSEGRVSYLCSVLRSKLRLMLALEPTTRANSSNHPSQPPPSSRRGSMAGLGRVNQDERQRGDRGRPVRSPSQPDLPTFVVGIAASTGGPMAVLDLLRRLPTRVPAALLIAIHMPEKFTEAFATHLAKLTAWDVKEAKGGLVLQAGQALLAPGGQNMWIVTDPTGQRVITRVGPRDSRQTYVPSADKLLTSVAREAKQRAVAVVLSGMGEDGAEGATRVAESGGLVIAQSPETAVLGGMPEATIKRVSGARVLPIAAISATLQTLR